MNFKEFRKKLAHGQLKNTSAVDDAQKGDIDPQYYDTIRSLTNEGLIDISTRKPIIHKLVDLTFEDGRNVYPMVDGSSYLDDTGLDSFAGDQLVKILEIQDSAGFPHTPDSDGHILTPSYNSLRFTSVMMAELGEKVRIRYQALHPEIPDDPELWDDFDIQIPPSLLSALQLYVAGLYISHMNGQEHSAKGDSYYGAYLREMGEDTLNNNSSTSEVHEDTRFADRGFV
jgi:hypothetical protein